MKKLIINADDFGQSKGINRGIIQCHENGVVTSASLMVKYPAAIEAADYAKSNPTLGVGLHLDLGEWVCKDGNWKMSYTVVDLQDLNAVKNEISVQINRFFELMGRNPTHIDSHQHAHLNISILPILKKIACDLDVILRGCSNHVYYCGSFYGQSTNGHPYHDIISVNGFKQILLELPDCEITEIGCHPGFDNDIETMYAIEREIEVETLCNPALRLELLNKRYHLTSFEGIKSSSDFLKTL